jgi:hypothetical protein
MIAPLAGLPLAGMIWYQGEANTYNGTEYAGLLETMVRDWRACFGAGKPFFYVQIAPFQYGRPREGAVVRDEQRKAMARIPNSGMVVISDIGNISDIHPANKTDVGKRLARWALNKHYKQQVNTALCGPLFKDVAFGNGGARIRFEFADGLRSCDGRPLTDFTLAGADRLFYPATARIENNSVWVWSDSVPQPVALRFAFENTATPNLCNSDGLPASTFRTDDWPVLLPSINIAFQYADADGSARVKLSTRDTTWRIRYNLNGSAPTLSSPFAEGTIRVPKGRTLLARLFRPDGEAADRIDTFQIRPNLMLGQPCLFSPQPNRKFPPASGEYNLTDGLLGSTDFADGRWVGYQGENAEFMFDLGKRQYVGRVVIRFLVNSPSWIILPKNTRVWFSEDSMNFRGGVSQALPQVQQNEPARIVEVVHNVNRETRFLRIQVQGPGTLPDWHSGAGGKAWFFVDEVVAE